MTKDFVHRLSDGSRLRLERIGKATDEETQLDAAAEYLLQAEGALLETAARLDELGRFAAAEDFVCAATSIQRVIEKRFQHTVLREKSAPGGQWKSTVFSLRSRC